MAGEGSADLFFNYFQPFQKKRRKGEGADRRERPRRRTTGARHRKLVGAEVSVLVEGPSQETELLWEGRRPGQAPEIDGATWINDFEGVEPRPSEIRRLRITKSHDYDVVGTLLPPSEPAPRFAPAPLINISPVPA